MTPIKKQPQKIMNYGHHKISLNRKYQIIAFGLLYLVWNFRRFYYPVVASGLDPSWVVGLNWATFLKLNWSGNNLIFTYGPLYSLVGYLLPEFHSTFKILIINVGLNLFYTACFTYVYYLFVKDSRTENYRWISTIVAVVLLIQKPDVTIIPLFVAFVFLPLVFLDESKTNKTKSLEKITRYVIMTFLIAVIPFTKFSQIYASLVFVLALMMYYIFTGKPRDAVLIGFLFCGFTVVVWSLSTKENIAYLFPYLASRFEVSGGYTEAMMIEFTHPEFSRAFILALIYLFVLLIILIFLFLQKQYRWATAWILPMIVLFLGFKGGFVRADGGHLPIFLNLVYLSALYFFYLVDVMNINGISGNFFPDRQLLAQIVTPLLIILTFSVYSFSGSNLLWNPESNLFVHNATFDFVDLVSNPSQTIGYSQEKLKAEYHLDPELISLVNPRETIDIIPWDISLLYAYNWQWTPRPVLQSYSSYTTKLDDLDAEFYNQSESPRKLLYSLSTIDNRYPIFDTPHTFRVLLDNYEFITRSEDERYVLFGKVSEPLHREFVKIESKEFGLYDPIMIPQTRDSHVFMAVEITPTVFGKLMNLFYKSGELYVEISTMEGNKFQHRFVRDTGNNGIFVSKYVQSLDDLGSVFDETYQQNIQWVRFYGNHWFYQHQINATFYEVPFHSE